MTTAAQPSNLSVKAPTIAAWVLQLALGGLFVAAGGSKLAGVPDMVALFDQVGVGQWFRYATGAIEVVAGLALLVPALVPLAALVLGATLVGALLTHLLILQTSFVHVLVLAALLAVLVWLRRDRISPWLSRLRA